MLPLALRSSFGFVGPRRFSWGLWVRVFDESVLVTHNRYPWDTNTTVHYTLHVYKDRTLMLNITTVLNRIKHLIQNTCVTAQATPFTQMQTVTFDTSNTEEAGVRGKGQRIGNPIHQPNPDLCETMFTRTA